MGWADRKTAEEVKNIRDFATYAAQEAGIPYPAKKHLYAASSEVEKIFALYPSLNWSSMCKIVDWAKENKKRYPHIMALINGYRYAYADGYLEELAPNEDDSLETKIEQALEIETDPEWRRRLMVSNGPGRKIVYAAWQKRIQI